MDPSTEYKKNMTKKSADLTHEQRRLKKRAGTTYETRTGRGGARKAERSWAPDTAYGPGSIMDVTGGRVPGTDKPLKKRFGGLAKGVKTSKDESEY